MWTKKTKASKPNNGAMTIHTPDDDAGYDANWSLEKVRGWQAWQEAVKMATPDEIMAGLERALASEEWGCGSRGEKIPPMAVWLRARGWERRYTPEARA